MLSRRITAGVCALALAVPAVASARPATDPPAAYGGPSVAQSPIISQGDTKYDVTPTYADSVSSLSATQLAAAYGTTQPKATPVAEPVAGSTDDNTDGWRIAAVAEAGLLAAMVAAGAFVARKRPHHGATA
jgi:hypothetical protein